MLACSVVHCSIPELPNVVQNLKNPIRNGAFVLKATQYIGLSFTILHLAPDKSSMPTGKTLGELAQLDQAGARIIVKIALSEPAEVGKLTVQTVEEFEITLARIHWVIFARAGVKKQLVSAGSTYDFQCYFQGIALGITAVNSTSRSIPPTINPSRTQPSACRQPS